MTPFDALFAQLVRCTNVRFASRSRCAPLTTARGTGNAHIRFGAYDTITIEESGTWRDNHGASARFRTLSRWSAVPHTGAVSIEHLRLGENRPVALVELVPSTDGLWTTLAPHVCARDLYSATVRIRDRDIRVRWRIRGPSKTMLLEIHYLECA